MIVRDDASHAVDVHVGKRIRERRLLCGFSQERLAGSIGVKFQQLQKYEKAINRISAGRLWRASLVLDVPISWFFEGMSEGKAAATNEHEHVSDREILELTTGYVAIKDAETRDAVRSFIRALRSRERS